MPLDTGVSALQLAPDAEEMLQNSRAREATATAGRPGPTELGAPPVAAQPVSGPAPAAAAPKYDPEAAWMAHVQKKFPGLEKEHLDFAKEYHHGKMFQHQLKVMGKEHRALLSDYFHHAARTDDALMTADEKLKWLEDMTQAHKEEIDKRGGVDFEDANLLEAQRASAQAKNHYLESQERKRMAHAALNANIKKHGGKTLSHELDPRQIRLLLANGMGEEGIDDLQQPADQSVGP